MVFGSQPVICQLGFSPLTFVLQTYTIILMTTYPTPRPVRLEAEDLAIVQRIKESAPAGQAVSFSDAVRISLRFWSEHNPPKEQPDAS